MSPPTLPPLRIQGVTSGSDISTSTRCEAVPWAEPAICNPLFCGSVSRRLRFRTPSRLLFFGGRGKYVPSVRPFPAQLLFLECIQHRRFLLELCQSCGPSLLDPAGSSAGVGTYAGPSPTVRTQAYRRPFTAAHCPGPLHSSDCYLQIRTKPPAQCPPSIQPNGGGGRAFTMACTSPARKIVVLNQNIQ